MATDELVVVDLPPGPEWVEIVNRLWLEEVPEPGFLPCGEAEKLEAREVLWRAVRRSRAIQRRSGHAHFRADRIRRHMEVEIQDRALVEKRTAAHEAPGQAQVHDRHLPMRPAAERAGDPRRQTGSSASWRFLLLSHGCARRMCR